MRELWFIATLFWLFCLTPLWKVVLKNKWSMWSSIIILVALHLWRPNIELLCIGRVFNYGLWFYLGIVLSKTELVEKVLSKHIWATLIVGILIYVIGTYTLGTVTTLGGITFSFAFALVADNYIPRLFFSFRNYTYQIFLMGIFAQMLVKIVFRHVNLPYIQTYIVCIVVGLYVPVLLSKIFEKINWKPLSLCVGLKPSTK